jgi:hypothetical protein
MKWLFVCLAIFFIVAPAMAGEDPYVAIVGNDASANTFYISPKHTQFIFNQSNTALAIPVCATGTAPTATQAPFSFLRVAGGGSGATLGLGCEDFFAQGPLNQPEVCATPAASTGGPNPPFTFSGNFNARVTAGNASFFEWWIRLPKKPSGEINIVIECGILKPNAFAAEGFASIELCAAETGERIGLGFCTRQEIDPGVSPVINTALPKLTAVAYPGPFNVNFAPFHLTAFKNPSSYTLSFDPVTGSMANNTNSQVLDGSTAARILLKACMDKTVVTKLPVTGQINAFAPAETENDLEAGDIIQVRLDIPRQNTVDIYCNPQSVRLAGVGETIF